MDVVRGASGQIFEDLGVNTYQLKERLQNDLIALQTCINEQSLGDLFSIEIQEWLNRFFSEFWTNKDKTEVLRKFCKELNEKIPKGESLFYLGRDGVMYGHKKLYDRVLSSSLDLPKARFYAQRHRLVEVAASFLEKWGFRLLADRYKELAPLPIGIEKKRAILLDQLEEIEEVLKVPLDDIFTVRVEEWHRRFKLALEGSGPIDEIFALYVGTMQELFRDLRTGSPLEERSFLDREGNVYGEIGVRFYFGDSPENLGMRPHLIANALYQWLHHYEKALPPAPKMVASVERPQYAARMRLRRELQVIGDLLRLPFCDTITENIHRWHGRFVEAFQETEEITELMDVYFKEIQTILVDPIYGSPLELTTYLGTDNQVYGRKALICALSKMPLERARRSPFDHGSETLFSVKRHLIVEGVVALLEKYERVVQPLPEIQEMYRELEERGKLCHIPEDAKRVQRQERAATLAKEQEERTRIEEEIRAKIEQDIKDESEEYVRGMFGEVLGDLESIKKEEARRIQKAKEQADQLQAELESEEAAWKKRNEELTKRHDALDGRYESLSCESEGLKKEIHDLRLSIQATARAIEERNARDEKNAWGAIAQIALCAVASYATGYGIAQARGGGVMIGGTWAF